MTKTAPSPKNRKKFDIDLQYGKVREKLVADMLQDKKIEVKSERDVWQRTGNIAIEYESYGKPSGIMATESDYWLQNLCYKGCISLSFFILGVFFGQWDTILSMPTKIEKMILLKV